LEIRTNEICEEMDLAPKIFSKKKNPENNLFTQVFVNHIDAVISSRKTLTSFFVERINK
jgi:hypothetical protein